MIQISEKLYFLVRVPYLMQKLTPQSGRDNLKKKTSSHITCFLTDARLQCNGVPSEQSEQRANPTEKTQRQEFICPTSSWQ